MPAGHIGSRVFMDLVPLAGTTVGGNNHVLLWLDAYSGYLGLCGIDNKKPQSIISALDDVVSSFACNSHNIEEVVTDSEACFAAIRPHIMSSMRSRHLLTPPKQHNQRIERYVRTINDRMRSVLSGLTYVLPLKLYGELMCTVVYFMNMFPNKVHPTLTPAIVFNGAKMDCRQNNHVPFGSSVMVTETDQAGSTSKYSPRAELALVLGPSSQVRSAVHVYVHSTRMIKTRNRYVVVPMVPSDFGFESKAGTVQSAIPDFINYDPSLRAPASRRDYDEELPAHAGARAQNAKRAAMLRSLEALRIRNSFRHGKMPRSRHHAEILRIESLPPMSPGFATYTGDNLNTASIDESVPCTITEVNADETYIPKAPQSSSSSGTIYQSYKGDNLNEATQDQSHVCPASQATDGVLINAETLRLTEVLDGDMQDDPAVDSYVRPPETSQLRGAVKRSRTRSASTKAGKEASEAQIITGVLDGNLEYGSAVGMQARPPETSQLREATKHSRTRSASTKVGTGATETQIITGVLDGNLKDDSTASPPTRLPETSQLREANEPPTGHDLGRSTIRRKRS
jgi:hypothetical protein